MAAAKSKSQARRLAVQQNNDRTQRCRRKLSAYGTCDYGTPGCIVLHDERDHEYNEVIDDVKRHLSLEGFGTLAMTLDSLKRPK